ncbi:Hypothetical protein FKW44_016197 [Caligus rogercresseyi]|uniref:Uncharacterized protein n=1 Tax=Caligus rogercresseyi TaxID=217165 RepID=A0A7T8H243_CALRO|nr:Hypothetical protein FKW44_016197 [Caligus rogercresseyi]
MIWYPDNSPRDNSPPPDIPPDIPPGHSHRRIPPWTIPPQTTPPWAIPTGKSPWTVILLKNNIYLQILG